MNENYGEFCRALAVLVSEESRDPNARMFAALYFKNTLQGQSTTTQTEKHDRWKALAADIRQDIKDKMMHALLHTADKALSQAISNAASEIAVVELPFKEWPSFVTQLQIISNPQVQEEIKIAALRCLGYTLERLALVEEMVPNIPEIEPSLVDGMLTSIVDGTQTDKSEFMRHEAVKALKNSLYYIRKNMDNKAERDIIMKSVGEACCAQTEETRVLALSCLDIICETYYELLGDYMTHIYNLTTAAIKDDPNEDSKMAAIEVWSTLANVEQDLLYTERQLQALGLPPERPPCPNYIAAASEHLMPLLLHILTKVEDDADEETWSLQASAANCIELIGLTIEHEILKYVIPFVQQHIQSPDWHARDAAIVAFMSILEGSPTAQLGMYVVQSLEVMVNAFNDPSPVVQSSAVHCVGKMCLLHLEALQDTMVHQILQAFLAKLPDRPSMAGRCCTGIFNIATAVGKQYEVPPDSNVLSVAMMQLMQALLQQSDRGDAAEANLRVSSMSAAAALVSASAMDAQPIFRELLPHIIGRMDAVLNTNAISQSDKDVREQVLGCLCGLFQTLYQRMNKADVMPFTNQVMTLLLKVLQVNSAACHEESLLAIGAVAATVEEDFEVRVSWNFYMCCCCCFLISPFSISLGCLSFLLCFPSLICKPLHPFSYRASRHFL